MLSLQQEPESLEQKTWIYDLGGDPTHERKNQVQTLERNFSALQYNTEIKGLIENRDEEITRAHREIDYLKETVNTMDQELKSIRAGGKVDIDTEDTNPMYSNIHLRRSSTRLARPRFLGMMTNDVGSSTSLDNDTFALMMISDVPSSSWLLGTLSFLSTITIGIMIMTDQVKESTDSSIFNVPFKVSNTVRIGQFFAIFLTLATQNDILTSVQVYHHLRHFLLSCFTQSVDFDTIIFLFFVHPRLWLCYREVAIGISPSG